MSLIASSFFSTARADPWPQSAASRYFGDCLTIHKQRWPGVSETVLTRLCTCKINKLQTKPWELFEKANKTVLPYYMEQFVALTVEEKLSVMKEADASVKSALFWAADAEQECAPK